MAVFEADVLGRKGRMRVLERGAVVIFSPFADSTQYAGYRVLDEEQVLHQTPENESTFEILVHEAAEVAEGKADPSSSGADTLASEELLETALAKGAAEAVA